MKLYHGTDVFSADDILRNGIDLNASRQGLDFGAGFYVTPRLAQARVWAVGSKKVFWHVINNVSRTWLF